MTIYQQQLQQKSNKNQVSFKLIYFILLNDTKCTITIDFVIAISSKSMSLCQFVIVDKCILIILFIFDHNYYHHVYSVNVNKQSLQISSKTTFDGN